MSEKTRSSQICFERIVPVQFREIANDVAIAENPANRQIPASPFEAAGDPTKFWANGRVLKVRFLDGPRQVRDKIVEYASQWSRYANITFDFGDDADAEVRISFKDVGNWSAIGTDALVEEWFPKDGPTMNYEGLRDGDVAESEYSRLVLHEFGHALGLIHEHQSPGSAILWNEQEVISDLSGPPNCWDIDTIRNNVLEGREVSQFTEFDPKSIMLYSFPSAWTKNNLSFTLNTALSDTDIAFIRAAYPGRA
jgi:hypothetical protein